MIKSLISYKDIYILKNRFTRKLDKIKILQSKVDYNVLFIFKYRGSLSDKFIYTISLLTYQSFISSSRLYLDSSLSPSSENNPSGFSQKIQLSLPYYSLIRIYNLEKEDLDNKSYNYFIKTKHTRLFRVIYSDYKNYYKEYYFNDHYNSRGNISGFCLTTDDILEKDIKLYKISIKDK